MIVRGTWRCTDCPAWKRLEDTSDGAMALRIIRVDQSHRRECPNAARLAARQHAATQRP